MSSLSLITLVLGTLVLGWHLWLCLAPRTAGIWLTGFPRNIWAGRILAAVAIGWVALLVWQADIAWLEHYRLPFCALAPVAYVLIVVFVDELLAARALGGLFLLLPALILDAAFVYPSNSRLIMTGFAYLLVIFGMVLVWSPFMFRKMTAPWAGRPDVCRVLGAIGSAVGLGMLLLGWFVYR